MSKLVFVAVVACALSIPALFGNSRVTAQAGTKLTKADIDKWMTELSNWGRWGKDDQLGAVNLITAAKRKEAAALVREGISISLAHDVEKETAADNARPFTHTMNMVGLNNTTAPFSLDTFSVNYHGYAHTHLDALCHMFYQGRMYNGFSQNEVTQAGAARLSILNLKQGVFTRGILMDMARNKGVPYLEPGTAIYPEDLDAWEKKAGIKVGSGDVIFIRTGRWARRKAVGPWDVGSHAAGLHASCAKWLKARDVAIIGSDAASDVVPSLVEGVSLPIHQLTLVALGVNIFDNCDLETIGDAAAARKRWVFLLTAAPLAVNGGTGSPLNPIATY
jgi:kynurenine formamidase